MDNIFEVKFRMFTFALKSWSFDIDEYTHALEDQLLNNSFLLSERRTDVFKRFEERIKSAPELSYDFELYLSDEMHQIENTYTELAYNSIFVITYSYFEIKLKKLREMIDKYIITRRANPNLRQIKGAYITKFRKYIEQVSGISFKEETLWNEILICGKIRNCLVHNASNIITASDKRVDEQELYEIIKNDESFKLNEENGDFQLINQNFVFSFIEKVENYLNHMSKEFENFDKDNYK